MSISYLLSLLGPAIKLSLLQTPFWFAWPHCPSGTWTTPPAELKKMPKKLQASQSSSGIRVARWVWSRNGKSPTLSLALLAARRSNQSILEEINPEWCRNWSSSILATWCKEPTHRKRPWCWERLRAEEGGERGWDDWMASPTQWMWVWANSRRQWTTGKPGVLQFLGSQSWTWLSD